MRKVVVLAIGLLTGAALTAQTLSVPNQYPTIAAAIAAATPGQIVEIAPGTYFEHDLDFAGKAITVRGVGPATGVVIDAQQLGRGFQFRSGETPTSILEGVTILNGVANHSVGPSFSEHGGGILCLNSAPLIRGCRVINCRAKDYNDTTSPFSGSGGGIAITGAGARIENCWIEGCRAGGGNSCGCAGASAGVGGGIWMNAPGVIVGTTVRACTYPLGGYHPVTGHPWSSGIGAGIYASGIGTTIDGCNIELNGYGPGLGGSGAGLFLYGTGQILRTRFFGNKVLRGGNGGGAYIQVSGGAVVVEDCRFESNLTADGNADCSSNTEPGGDGAGLYVVGDPLSGSLAVRACDFIGNTCGDDQGMSPADGHGGGSGGGAHITPPANGVEISRSRFVGNRAGDGIPGIIAPFSICYGDGSQGGDGGGLYLAARQGATAVVDNCEFFDNRAGDGPLNFDPQAPVFLAGRGGAIAAFCETMIRFSTLVDNFSGSTNGNLQPFSSIFAGAVGNSSSFDFVRASIIRGAAPSHVPSTMSVAYSNIEGGFFGVGNIDVDPHFVDRARGNLHLAAGSPMIGAVAPAIGGNFATDIDGESRPIGAPSDMGADQFLRMGTADDFELRTRIAGLGRGTNAVIAPAVGDVVTLTIDSPGGTFDGWPVALVADYFAATSALMPNAAYPFIHMQNTNSAIVLIVPALAPAGSSFSVTTPAGLGGFVTRIQAFMAAPNVENGIIATTAAHDIVWP